MKRKNQKFLERNFDEETLSRVCTFYKFGFTISEKDENKFIN